MSDIRIPVDLLPLDGRFGCGPSKVHTNQLDHLVANAALLGTSHRQAPIKELVGRVRSHLATLFAIPDGYEVVLGNGGSTAFWDVASHSVIQKRSAHLSFGEFGQKFVNSASAPWLAAPHVVTTEPGTRGELTAVDDADVYAWPHNETSTGVMAPIDRVAGAAEDALVLVDATSAAGGIDFHAANVDIYYFAPQKNFASDGGLWFALMSPTALERVERIDKSGRYIPEFLSLQRAVENSRLNQTLNTPAITTLLLMEAQLEWMLGLGGLTASADRTLQSSSALYRFAESHELLTPFVSHPDHRSQVVVTIDVDEKVDAGDITRVMREHGVVDIDPYRKLGRNQLRVATFVGIEPADVDRLIASIRFVLDELAS
jgi:phosphoserine aminotransferase